MTLSTGSAPRRLSAVPSPPSWRRSDLEAAYDALRDVRLLIERVETTESGRAAAEHATRASHAASEAVRRLYRLILRLDAEERLRLAGDALAVPLDHHLPEGAAEAGPTAATR